MAKNSSPISRVARFFRRYGWTITALSALLLVLSFPQRLGQARAQLHAWERLIPTREVGLTILCIALVLYVVWIDVRPAVLKWWGSTSGQSPQRDTRWPIHELLAYLRPDLPPNAGPPWNDALLRVQDEFATDTNLIVWGRKWRGVQDSSLETIDRTAWSNLYLHPWAADPDKQRLRHAQKRNYSDAPWEYADIHVDATRARQIWPTRGCLMPRWVSMSQTIEYIRNFTEWRTATLGEGWALDFDRDLRIAFSAPNGPIVRGRKYSIADDTRRVEQPDRTDIPKEYWVAANFDGDAILSWGSAAPLTAYNNAAATKYDDIEIDYVGLMRSFPRVGAPPSSPSPKTSTTAS